jgi:hypothetical protein
MVLPALFADAISAFPKAFRDDSMTFLLDYAVKPLFL